MPVREPAQHPRWCLVFRVASDLLLLSLCKLQQIGASRPKAQLAIEPESARLDCFLVILSQLIRIHRDALRSRKPAQAAQYLRENPRDFSAAKRIERVEPNFDPLKEPDGL